MTVLDHIAIYAVHDGDELVGFSFDDQPGNAERERVHRRLDRADPGASLLLAGFSSRIEAQAFACGIAHGGGDECGWVIRYFAPDLTCVLVEFFNGTPDALTVEDMRLSAARAS